MSWPLSARWVSHLSLSLSLEQGWTWQEGTGRRGSGDREARQRGPGGEAAGTGVLVALASAASSRRPPPSIPPAAVRPAVATVLVIPPSQGDSPDDAGV